MKTNNEILKTIELGIKKGLEKLKFDSTFLSVVYGVNSDGTYIIKKDGQNYNVRNCTKSALAVGQNVWVKIPMGRIHQMYICDLIASSGNGDSSDDFTDELIALQQGLADIEALKKTGLKGDPGKAATIQVGTVTASESGSDPQVTNTGTNADAILNFVLPRGENGKDGAKGKDGIDGKDGEPGVKGDPGKQSAYTLPKAQFPLSGESDTLYIDTSVSPAMAYYWDGSDYKIVVGAGGNESATAVVTFLQSGWTINENGRYVQTVVVPGLTDSAEPQLQLPKGSTPAQAKIWDNITRAEPVNNTYTLEVITQPSTDLDIIVLNLPKYEGVAVGDLVEVNRRITAVQLDTDTLQTEVNTISDSLNSLPAPIAPWHTNEIVIGTFNGKDLYERCVSIYCGSLTANSTKSIKHDIPIGDIISINKTCVYSNSFAFSDILWWEPGNTSEYLACNFTKTDIKLISAGNWTGDVKTYFKVQYTKN